jgi:hypothetical protein
LNFNNLSIRKEKISKTRRKVMKIGSVPQLIMGIILSNTILLNAAGGTDVKGIFNYSNCTITIQQLGGEKCPKQGPLTLSPGQEFKGTWKIDGDPKCPTQIKGAGLDLRIYDKDWKIIGIAGNIHCDKKTGENIFGTDILLKSIDLVIFPVKANGKDSFGLRCHPHPTESR